MIISLINISMKGAIIMACIMETPRNASIYHVISRCVEIRNGLLSQYAEDLLADVLKVTQKKYAFELIDYRIMCDLFHFEINIEAEGPSISRIMQHIKGRFAQRFNRLTNRTGPVWAARYKKVFFEAA
jgi:REP element-mobilizing transposase RayT